MYFFEEWCSNCARDRYMNGQADPDYIDDERDYCPIIAKTFAYDVTDDEYPKEWRYGDDGVPMCTAFVEVGKSIPPEPDTQTLELFP